MSLVRSAELSAKAYGNPGLYAFKGSNTGPGISSQIFCSDKRKIMYMSESDCSESNDLNYFLDSPTAELIHTPEGSFESDYLVCESPYQIDYNEDKVRLKLQELERTLLGDNNDDEDQSMEIDGDWAHPIGNELLHDSPKESSSSDSSLSSISCSKEVSLIPACTTKQMLFDAAAAIAEGNNEAALAMISELRQRVSIQGDPPERIAAYMVEGLVARMAFSGKHLYKALKCKEPPSLDRLSAMQILFEVCPCFRFGLTAANGAIIETFKDEKSVHIIDFEINQGSQYILLLQTLAKQPGKKPHIRLTGVDDPETIQRAVGGLRLIGQRLENLAETLNLSFEFRAVASKTSNVTPGMLNCKPGEALAVNFAFQLHHMPDESVSTVNQRDQLLRMVKSLNPKLAIIVEQDMNTNTAPFLPRFAEAYNYYSTVFDSLDATLPRDSQDRVNVERHCLARDIVNIIACEGEERVERYEAAGKWRARMKMAGFTPCPMSQNVSDTVRKLIREYSERFTAKEEMGTLHFGWENKSLICASAWG